jgi:Cell Wall Hydrolase
VLKRSIDLDSYELTIEQKFSRGAKRVCALFAVSALTLSALDLANIRSAESAAQFIHDSRLRLSGLNIAQLPDSILRGIDNLASEQPAVSVTVAIPRDEIVTASRPFSIVAKGDKPSGTSPVAALDDLRHEDAIEIAMLSPPAMTQSDARIVVDPATIAAQPTPPQIVPTSPSQKLASVDPTAPTPPAANILLPSTIALLPPPAPGLPPPSPAQRLKLDGKERAKAERCLANAIYFEARGEPVRGQMAVAQVVINRVFSGFYPNDICGVVYQNAGRHLACQFTFACDGKSKAINERSAWARANRVAKQTLDGEVYVPEVAKSTHYHAVYVHPNWVGEMKKLVRYGIHNFYRPIAWGAGAEFPTWGIGPWNKKN